MYAKMHTSKKQTKIYVYMKIAFENSILRFSFLCRIADICLDKSLKVGRCYCSTEVLLFHKSNTRESSFKFNYLQLSHLKVLSQFKFQLPNATPV